MTKLRSVSVAAAIATAASFPVVAHAELPNGSEIVFEELEIQGPNGAFYQPESLDLKAYLNMAHCMCSQQGAGMETSLRYLVRTTVDTNTSKALEFWVGDECDNEKRRPLSCRLIDSVPDLDVLVTRPERIELSLYDVITGFNSMAACPAFEGPRNIWALVDTDGDTNYDYANPISAGTTPDVTSIDTEPPPLPSDFVGASAENAIRLTWDPPDGDSGDVFAYQALCSKTGGPDDGAPGRGGSAEARYQRVRDLCDIEADNITVEDVELSKGDETPAVIPAEMRQLDPAFICGESADATATGMLITGLDNDQAYSVVLVAIDEYGNAAGAALSNTITPRIAFDFWEDLHGRGSDVEGGFCLTGGTIAGGGPLALALGLLLVRRRRRVLRFAAAAGAVVLVGAIAAPSVASAQGTTPYWEEQQAEEEALAELDLVRWHVGLRLGPYTPAIDKQFGTEPGPYEEMFGGYQVMPVIDIDRIVWRGFGNLGFGGSIGYMQKTANAWAEGGNIGDPDRMRSSGDENTFRLLPLAATAVYRFTWLDDNYGIPLVPYLRGGLSYYIWWFQTNGNTSKACWDGTDTPNCDADKAVGATLGFQGSVGLAIRAERIDSATATSMRAGGVLHAGFYAELQYAQVNGFGSDYKLSVGDATWFAGVNFEF